MSGIAGISLDPTQSVEQWAKLLFLEVDPRLAPYNASGSPFSTTGSMTSGSVTLDITGTLPTGSDAFEPGQGITVRGVGANGTALVTSIVTISGTSFTLATQASTTASGVTVEHNDNSAITACIADLPDSGFILNLGSGQYIVDGNVLIRNKKSFGIIGSGAVVYLGYADVTRDIHVIADCSDFDVTGVTFDGRRDTTAPLNVLLSDAASGQATIEIAAGAGKDYVVGQALTVNGGLYANGGDQSTNTLGADANKQDLNLTVSSISAGTGPTSGDVITFTANLANSYTAATGTLSDGFGPYAGIGAYVYPYQTASGNSVAGRSLGGENQQNGLHLINCQRFSLSKVTGRNTWESPIKLGTGFNSSALTDGCSDGTVIDCDGYHAYDQGVSAWLSQRITVMGCKLDATGWAGVSFTHSDNCVAIANQIRDCYYRVPNDANSGSGVVTEGGLGNRFIGNTIKGVWSNGVRLVQSPLDFGIDTSSPPTLTVAVAANTAAGTSIEVSDSSVFTVNASYSIAAGLRTESVTIASIVDATHVTFADSTTYPHYAGEAISARIAQDNIVVNNVIDQVQIGHGIPLQFGVRTTVKDNKITRSGVYTTGTYAMGIFAGTATYGNQAMGPYGSQIIHNIIEGSNNENILITDNLDSIYVDQNETTSTVNNSPSIHIQGLRDGSISHNKVHDVTTSAGILIEDGSGSHQPQRLKLIGNQFAHTNNEGIIVLDGSGFTIVGNTATSCMGNAGIDLRSLSHSTISKNLCISNENAGLRLENNGTAGCLHNVVEGNICRDDGSGTNVNTGASFTQPYGILEQGNSDHNQYRNNQCDSNSTAQISTVGANSTVQDNPGFNNLPQESINTEITGTTAQTVLTYTPVKQALFTAKCSLEVVTATTTVTVTLTWTTPQGNSATYGWISSQSLALGVHALPDYSFAASTAGAIELKVTAGTANQVYATTSLGSSS